MVRVAVLLAFLLTATSAHAIRPFITDDARTVGAHRLQLETWFYAFKGAVQQWLLPAFGPNDYIELTLGMVHGLSYGEGVGYNVAGPLAQMKLLLHHAEMNRWPGVALAGGVVPSLGHGEFHP